SVSKRWCTLIADPYFIGRFVSIKSYKRTPKICTLITKSALEFPLLLSSPPINLLTPVLKGFLGVHRLMEKPVVVAIYNDLVLFCITEDYQRDYYICNAYTMQYAELPPTASQCHKSVRVGIICNVVPDYKFEEDDWKGNNIHLNVECRFTVVRILPPVEYANDEKKDVEIFSSDTGEWRESVVSSPRHFNFGDLNVFSFAYNGYWPTDRGLSVIGLGPFYDNDGTSSSSSNNGDCMIDHKLRFTVFEETLDFGFSVQYLGVCGGYVLMCNMNRTTRSLYVYELKQTQDGAAAGKNLCLSKRGVYSFDPEMIPINAYCVMIAFYPNNKDIFYLHVRRDIIKWNIRTGEWSKLFEHWATHRYYYTVVLPWWPTPVPRLAQQHAHRSVAEEVAAASR
ncbi:Galactose oxidase/kelch repeat superfamily protein, partial [Prunus dulcis]